jgi:hypothetical protein
MLSAASIRHAAGIAALQICGDATSDEEAVHPSPSHPRSFRRDELISADRTVYHSSMHRMNTVEPESHCRASLRTAVLKRARRATKLLAAVAMFAGVFGAIVTAQVRTRPSGAPIADTLFVNGKVFTADSRSGIAEGFAVKDGRFFAVGASSAMRAYAGKGTSVIDLHGRTVTPGLSDGHFHNEGGGHGLDLSATRSLADLLAAVEAASKKARPGQVIVSNSDWHEAQLREQRLPLAREIDAVSPNVPVVLVRGGHEMILNSAALRTWNITSDQDLPMAAVFLGIHPGS